MNAAERDSAFMRTQLALAGIVLDERKPDLCAPVATASAPPIDRGEIRAVLVLRGAPDRDLDWLTASAPSLAHALAYLPTEEL